MDYVIDLASNDTAKLRFQSEGRAWWSHPLALTYDFNENFHSQQDIHFARGIKVWIGQSDTKQVLPIMIRIDGSQGIFGTMMAVTCNFLVRLCVGEMQKLATALRGELRESPAMPYILALQCECVRHRLCDKCSDTKDAGDAEWTIS